MSSRKDADNYKDKLGLDLIAFYAADFAKWKQKFSEIQNKVDILIVGNTAGINDFDEKAAQSHALKHAKIPSGAVQIEPMPFAMVGYLKVAEEQGVWSAKAALDILQGKKPSDIPITKNTQGKMVVNIKMAEALKIEIPFSLIESASSIIE